ncbi:MAG: hypothetical protein ABS79_05650 [Planctomycetes bacterium SCN 63-9]|nr:MAG: hypothetical protein ABS79_05650 [Planctomycetes bacterium SCN 63-9]
MTFAQTGDLLATFRASSPVALDAGTRYWIVLSQSGDGVNWSVTSSQNYVSPIGWSIGPRTQSNDNGNTWLAPITGSSPLFAVNAPAAVPEPSSLIMAGIAALAGLGAWTRRRQG